MDEDTLNMAIRKFLKEVGVSSQREIERLVRDHKVKGSKLVSELIVAYVEQRVLLLR